MQGVCIMTCIDVAVNAAFPSCDRSQRMCNSSSYPYEEFSRRCIGPNPPPLLGFGMELYELEKWRAAQHGLPPSDDDDEQHTKDQPSPS